MSIAIPHWLGPWLVGAGLVCAVLAFAIAIQSYTGVRRGEYYVLREEARQRALRAMVLFFFFVILTLVFLLIPRRSPTPRATEPTPTATHKPPVETPTQAEPTSTPTPTATATPKPTATEPFIPTLTPQTTLPPAFDSPLPGSVPPPADAQLDFWTLARGVDENNRPVGAATEFEAGVERIYLFYFYDGLLPDTYWTTVWYREGEMISGGTSLWESQRSRGEGYVFLTLEGGYPPGEYEVQVWLGHRLQILARFSVVQTDG